MHQVAERYAQLKIELNKIEAEMEILKEKLQEKGPEIYDTKYGIVKVLQMAESKRFDTKRFKIEQPEMYEDCMHIEAIIISRYIRSGAFESGAWLLEYG